MTYKNTIIVIAPTRNEAKAMALSLVQTRGINTDETYIVRLWEDANPAQIAGVRSEGPILEIRLSGTDLSKELEHALQAVHTQKPKREVWTRTSGQVFHDPTASVVIDEADEEVGEVVARPSPEPDTMLLRKTEDQEIND